MLKSDSRLVESRQRLCAILHPWENLNLVHLLSRTTQTREKQLKQYIARSTLCLVTVNMSKTLLVIPPYQRATVAAMIAQLYKTAVIERNKACIRTLQSHLPPLCAGPHGHENLWIAIALYRIGRLRLRGGECGAIIGRARVCSRVITWLARCVRTVSCVVAAHSVLASLCEGCFLFVRT